MTRTRGARDIPPSERKRIVELIKNQGRTAKDVALMFNRKPASIYSIIAKQEAENIDAEEVSIQKSRGGNKKCILTEEHLTYIDQCLTINCKLTQKYLTTALNQEFDLNISPSTLKRTMDRMGYTLKLIKSVPFTRNSDETIEDRYRYCLWLSSISQRHVYTNLIFIDESGFNPGMRRKQGYSLKGFPAIDIQIQPRTSNINIIGAMNGASGIMSFDVETGKVRGENIVKFVNNLIQKILTVPHNFEIDLNEIIYIVWDNASIHKAREVEENCFTDDIIQIHGLRVHSKFLPCYSPFLNPIEEAWSHSKFDVQASGISGNDTLTDRITAAMANITPQMAQSFTDHMMKFVPTCLQRQPIFNEGATSDQREMERFQRAQAAAGRRIVRGRRGRSSGDQGV